mmetsp:Transcript_54177/g.155676  ORF Transcript_54177/g.155676 Transcript_54177/m.155676 type:complete len:272 (-) Transcript_54177:3223-4038(-)
MLHQRSHLATPLKQTVTEGFPTALSCSEVATAGDKDEGFVVLGRETEAVEPHIDIGRHADVVDAPRSEDMDALSQSPPVDRDRNPQTSKVRAHLLAGRNPDDVVQVAAAQVVEGLVQKQIPEVRGAGRPDEDGELAEPTMHPKSHFAAKHVLQVIHGTRKPNSMLPKSSRREHGTESQGHLHTFLGTPARRVDRLAAQRPQEDFPIEALEGFLRRERSPHHALRSGRVVRRHADERADVVAETLGQLPVNGEEGSQPKLVCRQKISAVGRQ